SPLVQRRRTPLVKMDRSGAPHICKGACTKGDSCTNLHYDDGGKPSNRGRSPSRDKNKESEWKPKTEQTS
ncbi:MAG: hypothetical protein ACKPKO_41770, partial [Candidatus Fonsibacter sp.]